MLMRYFGGGVGHLHNPSGSVAGESVEAEDGTEGEIEDDLEQNSFTIGDESASGDSDDSSGLPSSDESDDGYASP